MTAEVIAAIAAEIGPRWEQERVDRLVSRPWRAGDVFEQVGRLLRNTSADVEVRSAE